MDIDINLLGPYAAKYQQAVDKIFNSKPTTEVAKTRKPVRANFEALHKKQNVKFLQVAQGIRGGRLQEMEDRRKERRSGMFMKSRKSNMTEITNELNTLIHEDSSNEISALECTDNSGNSTQTGNNNTAIMPANPIIADNSRNYTNRNNNKNSQEAVNPVNNSVKDSRREQLLRWKREKEAADVTSKRNMKQPFKAGLANVPAGGTTKPPAPAPTKNASVITKTAGNNVSLASKNANTSKVTTGRPVSAPAPRIGRTAPAPLTRPANGVKIDDSRRVTRAMSKATVVGTGTCSNPPTGRGRLPPPPTMNPAIQKMKNLQISDKSSTGTKPGINKPALSQPVSKPGQLGQSLARATRAPPATGRHATVTSRNAKPGEKKSKSPVPGPSKSKESSSESASTNTDTSVAKDTSSAGSSTGDRENVPKQQDGAQSKPERPKKLKPKAIDATYIDYNSRFSNACVKLKSFSCEWTKLLEFNPSQGIPENVQGDIRSALGKVKLLLESKLPQFGELLYSYLCQEVDPNPVLACDLQGWWDVVSIQLDLADTLFDGLGQLKENNWTHKAKDLPPGSQEKIDDGADLRQKIPLESRPPRPCRPPKISAKVQASGGLKAFLANKRKMVVGSGENKKDVDVNEAQEPEPVIEKTFEGGFFTISSPKPPAGTPESFGKQLSVSMGTPLTPFSALPRTLRTPNRHGSRRLSTTSEASFRRASLSILGVRKSMGSFNKIGVVSISSEDSSNKTSDDCGEV